VSRSPVSAGFERTLDPRPHLTEQTAVEPVHTEPAGHELRRTIVTLIEEGGQRSSNVLELRIQDLEPVASSFVQGDARSFGQRTIEVSVSLLQHISLAPFDQAFKRELADRLEHPDPRLVRVITPLDQALIQENRDGVGVCIRDALDSIHRGPAHEDGYAAEGVGFSGGQERMTPFDGRAQCPLSGIGVPPTRKIEYPGESVDELVDREHLESCYDQLHRKGKVI
jgi:hypothetical protein